MNTSHAISRETPLSWCVHCGAKTGGSAKQSSRVLFVGDSHTHGPFGKELERLLASAGASVTRAGRIGSAVKFWLPKLPALLREHHPDLVIVALGANMREYPSPTGTSAHFRSAVRLIKNERPQARIVWIGPPRKGDDSGQKLQRFNQILKSGLDPDVLFVDSGPHTPRYVGGDGVHYSDAAAKAWAKGVFAELSSVAQEAASNSEHETFSEFEDSGEFESAGETELESFSEFEDFGDLEVAGEAEHESEADWGFDPSWTPLVLSHYKAGTRDRGKLTNTILYAQKHAPEGHVIKSNERDLIQKWVQIRDTIVDPALNRLVSRAPVSGAVISPLAVVSRFGLRTEARRRTAARPVHGVVVHTTGSGPAEIAAGKKRKVFGACDTPLDCALGIYAKMDGFAHYVIDYQGLIVATCSEDREAWHAGANPAAVHYLDTVGPPAWWKKTWKGVATSPWGLLPRGKSPNDQYLGIELLQTEAGGSYTEAQYRSLAALLLDIERRHGIKFQKPPSRNLLGHEDVNPAPYTEKYQGRSFADLSAGWDPGASRGWFSWDKLWNLMRGGSIVSAPPQVPAQLPPAPVPPPQTPTIQPSSPLSGGLSAPQDPSKYRKFRLTHYYLANQVDYPTGKVVVPILDAKGNKLAEASPHYFAKLSLEGSGFLADNRYVNVTGKMVPVDPDVFAPVWEHHQKYLPTRPPGYSGIAVAGGRVHAASAFHVVPQSKLGIGFGVQRGIPYTPYRTLAADIGAYKNSEKAFRGKGGLVPPKTRVFIKEFVGVKLPDGTVHDGWFIVNDTGGGIFGAHFDVFAGTKAMAKAVKLPSVGTVWFPGIEQRMAPGYDYGLRDR